VDIVHVSVLVIGAQNAFVNVGALYVQSTGIGVMWDTLPILTPIAVAGLLTEERLSVSDGVWILVGFVGVLMVVQPTPQILSSEEPFGYVLVFVGMAALALGTVISQRVDPSLGTLPATAWGMILGGNRHLRNEPPRR
jgi:drug/metabolite transporter (DMT)-like permease